MTSPWMSKVKVAWLRRQQGLFPTCYELFTFCCILVICWPNVGEGLYWSSYWERYKHAVDNDNSYDYDYYTYDDDEKVVVRPTFVQTTRNVSVHRGTTATLCCQVEHLGSKTVVWRRAGVVHPLTIGLFTFVSDPRVTVKHNKTTNTWCLTVNDVQLTDDGTYQCQINSKDDQTNFYNVHLHVVMGRPLVSVHVTGTETVVRGGQIQLVCKASGSSTTIGGGVRPRSVLWVKDGRQLSSEVGGRMTVSERVDPSGVESVLVVRRSTASDSGIYQCRSTSDRSVAIRRVHVLNAASLEKRGTGRKLSLTSGTSFHSRQFRSTVQLASICVVELLVSFARCRPPRL